MGGVKVGYQHKWYYNENDYSKGKNIYIKQLKSRVKRARGEGGFKQGSQIIWGISASEKVVPTRKGYKHIIKGVKKQIKFRIKGRRWK